MTFLSRAIAAKLLPFSQSSRKRLLVLYPIAVQQQSSLFSTTAAAGTGSNKSKNQQQHWSINRTKKSSKTHQPQQQSSSSSLLGPSEIVQKKKSEVSIDWPRPSEIPWQAKVANSVNLIGEVQIPVHFESSLDGKNWAGTVIAQQDTHSKNSPQPFWIPIIFEGDLAHIAACHLKEKDCVYIAGQLSADPPPFTLSRGQANVQVMVQSINFIQGSSQSKKSFVPCKQEELAVNRSESVKDDLSVDQSLIHLITKPHEWWDIRLKKENSTAAAFEHKENGELLWINESTPEWVVKKLDCLTFDIKIEQKSLNGASMTKDGDTALSSWRDLLKNPNQWWDHRENKLNGLVKARHPDFKHKDNGTGLWIVSAPKWVLPGLAGLELDVPLRKMKRVNDQKDDSWKDLVENPHEWWDNRSKKVNERSPDFKHKETNKALWLSNSPAWALSRLPPLKAN